MYIIKHHHRRYALHIMNTKLYSNGKQFQQYHQNKQTPLISNNQNNNKISPPHMPLDLQVLA